MAANETQTETQRKANRRLGLVLGAVALMFGVGFVTRIVLFGA
jgi:hypothetical protein